MEQTREEPIVNSVRTAVFLLLVSTQALAEGAFVKTAGQGYNPFASAMDMMMDAMDRYSKKRAWGDALSGYGAQAQPWSWGAMPGMTPQMPGQSQMQQMLQSAPATAQAFGGMARQMPGTQQPGNLGGGFPARAFAPIPGSGSPFQGPGASADGIWQGSSGEVLIVRNGYCRIYASRENYNDCRFAVQGSNALITSATSGQSRQYEYAIYQDRMALRDSDGDLLLYRRLPESVLHELVY